MAKTIGQGVAMLSKIQAGYANFDDSVLPRVAARVKRDSTVPLVAAVGGDLRMGKKRVGLRYTIHGGTADFQAVGPVHWLERGTDAHLVGAGRVGRTTFVGRAARGKFLKGQGYKHPVRAPIVHPGANARGTFTKMVRVAERSSPRVFAKEHTAMIRKALG